MHPHCQSDDLVGQIAAVRESWPHGANWAEAGKERVTRITRIWARITRRRVTVKDILALYAMRLG
jgi:hypothetical protein